MFIAALLVLAENWKQYKCPSKGWMVKWSVVYSHHGILLSNKNEWTMDVHNLNVSQGNCTEWKIQSQSLMCIIITIKMSINKKLMRTIFMYFHKQLCEEGRYLEPRGLPVLCPLYGIWLRLKQWFWGLDCLSGKKKK